MKKFTLTLLITLLTVALAGSVFAQEPMKFGVKAGLSIASLSGDDVDDLDSRMGIAGGAFALIELSPGLIFQPELLYVQKGAEFEEGIEKMTLRLDYLDVGLFLRKDFPSESMSPYILGGPVLALNSTAEMEYEIEGVGSDTEDMGDVVKSMSFGFLAGAGIALDSGLFVEARYQLGLSSIDDTEDSESIKCNTIMLMAGMSF